MHRPKGDIFLLAPNVGFVSTERSGVVSMDALYLLSYNGATGVYHSGYLFSIEVSMLYSFDMAKHKRSGGKIGGKHTSFIPLADEVVGLLLAHPDVTKVVPGFITSGLSTLRGNRRIKLSMYGTALKLSVRDNISHQEVFVHAGNEDDTQRLAAWLVDEFEGRDVHVVNGL